ncbi:phosphatidylinositol-specific phospholipase C/glycerophosphodiester phosphodiesterase family protein [Streptomyces pathocidini]|uniref:phosphatidylinositol-specific phospholipase C/glycerophosphodiester phosphodiesterase family protein n=1 Tax=Streptomyces pathocidini TaxID=1650571 RepID=UPI0033DE89D6
MSRPSRRTLVTSLGGAMAGSFASPPRAWSAQPSAAEAPTSAAAAVTALGTTPLRRAHAHNDYEHERPLADALSHGFTSVEADIWLIGGQLLVGHDLEDLTPERTLEALYLDPLVARVRANGGWVHRGHRIPLQLLIDLKNTGEETYLELDRRLRPYRRMLTSAADGRVRTGAVTPVISGERAARAPMEAQRLRYAFYDGRLEDLGMGVPASFLPLVSANWTSVFTWQGLGPMPAAERAELREIVSAAHRDRQRVRFWATPDAPGQAREAVWQELLSAGVDHINTDDLAGLQRFLTAYDRGRA